MTETADEILRIPQQVTLEYRFAAGEYASHFFTTLKNEGRLMARRCPSGHVLLPWDPLESTCRHASLSIL